ncbi:hypothetical protein CO653_31040 [Rhizobium anhuiense]|nr:hypothetical protein CO653_31040 [Rhizobium anhuiense]
MAAYPFEDIIISSFSYPHQYKYEIAPSESGREGEFEGRGFGPPLKMIAGRSILHAIIGALQTAGGPITRVT